MVTLIRVWVWVEVRINTLVTIVAIVTISTIVAIVFLGTNGIIGNSLAPLSLMMPFVLMDHHCNH